MIVDCSQINQTQFEQIVAIEQTVQPIPWQATQFVGYQAFRIDKNVGDMGFVYLDENKDVFAYWFGQRVFDELHLHNISVAKHVQKQGLGRLLLCHFLETAGKLACQSVWLEVRESNLAAIALYQKCGFSVVGRRQHYYALPTSDQRESALILSKIL